MSLPSAAESNSLVRAAELSARGRHVIVLEREQEAGGCIRTAGITRPGFLHDLFPLSYPLFATACHFPALRPMLDAQGLHFVRASYPAGVLLPDGRWTAIQPDRGGTAVVLDGFFEGDGDAYRAGFAEVETHAKLIFGLLGEEPRGVTTIAALGKALVSEGLDELAAFGGDALMSLRAWLERVFASDIARALFTPWVLHAGLGPDAAASALMGKLILYSLEAGGLPLVEGGSARIVEAFTRIIEQAGGSVITDADVSSVRVENGTAHGITTADGRTFRARRAVVCNVTPPQLYGKLLPTDCVPEQTLERALAYRFGHACLQTHIALFEPPAWPDPDLAKIGCI